MRMVERLREQGIANEHVLAAMQQIPRHLFVDDALSSRAYEDISLPIGFGQTISQPYTVAKLAELMLQGNHPKKILEIGTGCGYQSAVLSRLVKEVFSIERISGLATKARVLLRELRLYNIKIRHQDGHIGLQEVAPFDAIVMTAASAHAPQALVDQLADGGRFILPMTQPGNPQQKLCVIQRVGDSTTETWLEDVHFVPLLAGTTTLR